MPNDSLISQLAQQAELIVDTLEQTQYQYTESIDPDDGVYDCDCNSFVAFVVEGLAPLHYAAIPKETGTPRPRAFEYVDFFNSLADPSPSRWQKIVRLADGGAGDILAWRFPQVVPGEDTGHVVFLAETPSSDAGGVFTVRVFDSAAKPHFRDTRGPDEDQFANGVGSGVLNFQVDAQGAPTAFLFGPGAAYVAASIAIGRAV